MSVSSLAGFHRFACASDESFVTKWRKKQIASQSVGATVSHWQPEEEVEEQKPRKYPFDEFDKKTNIIEYSTEEYEQYCIDADWTKEV